MVDDYGHWEGARKAVDEYIGRLNQVTSQCNGLSTIPAGDI